MKKTPQVNEVNEFLEIASDFEDPLEVIRESLSNAYDAEATEVEITIRNREHGSDIVIEDDGCGMSALDLESFFDLGNSRKSDSIGYKGHGTKIFYKSDRIEVTTVRGGTSHRAVMVSPWEKLNRRELPQYEVTSDSVRHGNPGTSIKITNFRSGQGFNTEELTYDKIHHYLKWKTVAGSMGHYFGDSPQPMTIRVDLGSDIDNTRDKLVTINRLELPEERLSPDDSEFPAERMCKHYPPQELTVEYDGGTTTAQIVGMVGGKAARNELPTYGRHSTQFGVWLSKDHIKIERYNEAISHDNEFLHFFFVANCQEIELSANRETIRNKSSSVYRALCEEIEYYLSKVVQDPWFKEYLSTRREGEYLRQTAAQLDSLRERRERIERDGFAATNPTEVLLGLERASRQQQSLRVSVENFHPNADVNSIIRHQGQLRNASIRPLLTDLFADQIPLTNTEVIVCWELGDAADLREYERHGYLGGDISFNLEKGSIEYHNRESSYIEIMAVGPLLERRTELPADD